MRTWDGCYDDSWRTLIVDEAYQHPAKMARGLVARIFDYLFEKGYLRPGETVCDPFGGIGSTGIEAASRGVRAVCVELEGRFVSLGERNFELHRATWDQFGDPQPVILQGDSRELRRVLANNWCWGPISGAADCVVGSPPFCEQQSGGGIAAALQGTSDYKTSVSRSTGSRNQGYNNQGQTPGQLGAMPAGDVDAVVGSPPYAGSLKGDNSSTETASESRDKRQTPGGSLGQSQRHQGYGGRENLGNMPEGDVDCILSSPPYEGAVGCGGGRATNARKGKLETFRFPDGSQVGRSDLAAAYGDTEGNIGNEQGDTFWQAAAQIVAECYAILKPSGVAVFVCKDFIRKGKRVPFSDQWQALCERCGFSLVERIRASLVKEDRAPSLFGGEDVRTKERKSFFRRLAEAKGSPRIDWEDVVVVKKC